MPTDRSKRRNQDPAQEQGSNQSEQERDLKAREYRDAEGNIHHHTHKYVEQHGSEAKSEEEEEEEEE